MVGIGVESMLRVGRARSFRRRRFDVLLCVRGKPSVQLASCCCSCPPSAEHSKFIPGRSYLMKARVAGGAWQPGRPFALPFSAVGQPCRSPSATLRRRAAGRRTLRFCWFVAAAARPAECDRMIGLSVLLLIYKLWHLCMLRVFSVVRTHDTFATNSRRRVPRGGVLPVP